LNYFSKRKDFILLNTSEINSTIHENEISLVIGFDKQVSPTYKMSPDFFIFGF